MEDLRVKYYKDHIDRNEIENRIGITLWSFEMYR